MRRKRKQMTAFKLFAKTLTIISKKYVKTRVIAKIGHDFFDLKEISEIISKMCSGIFYTTKNMSHETFFRS